MGEAGIGKSRLCYEFARGCRGRGIDVWEGHCIARGEALPLLVLLEFLRSYFGITDRDRDRAAREKIAGRMLLRDEGLRVNLELVFDFLGVPDPERPACADGPEARQRHLFDTLNRLVAARWRREPAVLVCPDAGYHSRRQAPRSCYPRERGSDCDLRRQRAASEKRVS